MEEVTQTPTATPKEVYQRRYQSPGYYRRGSMHRRGFIVRRISVRYHKFRKPKDHTASMASIYDYGKHKDMNKALLQA